MNRSLPITAGLLSFSPPSRLILPSFFQPRLPSWRGTQGDSVHALVVADIATNPAGKEEKKKEKRESRERGLLFQRRGPDYRGRFGGVVN